MLVLGTLSIATGSVDINEEKESETGYETRYRNKDLNQDKGENSEIICENVQKEASSMSEEELIEVMIRLNPYQIDDFEGPRYIRSSRRGTDYVSELRDHSREQQSEITEFLEEGSGEVINTFWIANAVLAEVGVEALDELKEFNQVWRVHENFEIEIHESNSQNFVVDEDSSPQSKVQIDETSDDLTWGLERINASKVWEGGEIWDEGFNGTDVRVAVSDTGLDIEHPDLEGKLVSVDEDDPHYPGGWIEIDSSGEIVQDSTPHEQHIGHGTHVSGTVVGGNASGTNIGVAPGVDLMHVGMYSAQYPVCSQLLATLEWKLEPRDRHGEMLNEVYGGAIEDYRPHVASMSWGGDYEEYVEEFEEPIKNLRNAGVVPVTSMGNRGERTVGTPGSIYEDIAVGASDTDDNIARFSSGDIVDDGREDTPKSYTKPDFAAPGVGVKSAIIEEEWGRKWRSLSGTSMATPHVAGTAALMLEANSDITIDEIYEALKISADYYEAGESLFQEEKNTRYGHGIINADKAVDYVSGLGIREVGYLTNEEAKLKAEVMQMPDDEIDELEVFFRYREKGEEDWLSTERKSISQPQEFEVELEDLNKDTTHEYKAVAQLDDKEETTFSLTFTTHRDVETLTWPVENVTPSSATLKGEVTDIYREEVEVFFRYRRSGETEWSETEMVTTDQPFSFKREIENLDYNIAYEYKVVGISNGEEFKGNLMEFTTSLPKPEWDEEESAYQVSNTGELQWMKNDLKNEYVLQNHINASETEDWNQEKGFAPIGNDEKGFEGIFEGNGYQIKHLYINRSDTDKVGLFRFIDDCGIVNDVGLTELKVNGDSKVGGMVGTNSGTIENSFTTGNVRGRQKTGGLAGTNSGNLSNSYGMVEVKGNSDLGGLVGRVVEGNVSASYSTGSVSGESHIGGLVGRIVDGTVSASYSAGCVSGESHIGGLVGNNWYGGTIENSYATGDVSGEENIGGLLGRNRGTAVVEKSYATGEVIGEEDVGGLVVDNTGTVSDSFWDIETSGIDTSDGGTGKTTAEMKDIATYTDKDTEGLEETWDFVDNPNDDESYEEIWDIDEDEEINRGYPFLSWEWCRLKIIVEGEGRVEVNGQEVTDRLYEGMYEESEEVELKAESEEGWYFEEWSGDYTRSEEEINITMDSDMEITANFKEEEENIIDKIRGIPVFTLALLILGLAIALAIYQKKRSRTN